MSWSCRFTGSAAEVIEQARAAQTEIESKLPEFERGDVAVVIEAAERLARLVPPGSSVELDLNGHGWRASTTGVLQESGAGAAAAHLTYKLGMTPPAPDQPPAEGGAS